MRNPLQTPLTEISKRITRWTREKMGVGPASVMVVSYVLALAAAACGSTPFDVIPEEVPVLGGNPLLEVTLFVDAESPASRQVRAWRDSRPADAEELEKIAREPQADWFGDWNDDVESAARERVRTATEHGAAPLFVAYNIPLRDCGSHSAGGAESPDAYRRWIRAFANGLGAGPAVVILEPDALAGADCLSSEDRATRFELIRDAVEVLSSRPGVAVYVDAGNPRWQTPGEMARRLRSAGVDGARGFALNVSNMIGLGENAEYGETLSGLLGGQHFVIDTSRNGLGPTTDSEWCNPPGRSLGAAPTTRVDHDLVDALLWIKRPGESDGTCNGGPSAGQWWADYALGLARRASDETLAMGETGWSSSG